MQKTLILEIPEIKGKMGAVFTFLSDTVDRFIARRYVFDVGDAVDQRESLHVD